MKLLLLLEIYDVDEEEEWDIKEEGEEKPQEAAAQKMAGGALKADEDEVKQEIAKQAKRRLYLTINNDCSLLEYNIEFDGSLMIKNCSFIVYMYTCFCASYFIIASTCVLHFTCHV